MSSVPSPQLCVPLASGGDPTYAFNVKLSGEEVHGTSKRHGGVRREGEREREGGEGGGSE